MKPSARASFFGRASELDHLARLLAEPQALVSLTGPPGSGKSRLAREHVAAVAHGFAGGVHWVDLAEARSVEEMCAAVAHAMGERLATGTSSEELVERLAQGIAARGEALIVLDDLEHLAELAPATIDVWRAHADASAFLVTSRERLRLAGERRIEIGPLPVPDERERDPESIARFDSVRLFVDRARAVRAGWTPSAEELSDAAALVRALDGIPLAIELCAARAAMLGTRQIRERLPAVLDLLAHGARGAAARSATVRGAIDCSWQLLDEGEQRAFAQCAVFRGGFTLEAAEQVLGTDALERLQALVDKSLLHVREVDGLPGELRFGMYEPLARYAAEQLDKTELRPDAEAKHARWFAEAGSRWAAAVDDASGGKMFRRLGCEAANLSAALARTMSAASEPERAERALRLTLALEPLLRSRGPIAELERRLDEALEAATEAAVPPALLARGMVARGLARYIGGDPATSVEELEAAAAAASSCGAIDLEALARVYLGVAAASVGKLAAARRELESAGTLAEQANAPRVDALARTHRARWVLARQGRSDEARRELERALELLQRTGATRDEGRVHAYLGHLFLELGALDDAGAHYQRATALLRDLGDARLEAELRVGLAVVEQELGRRAEAHGQLEEAKVMFEVIGVDAYRGILELHLGALALEDERRGEAVEHYARAAVLLEGHWAGGLSSVAMAGRAVAELLSGEAAGAGPRMQEARAAAQAASPAIARSVEMLACAFDLWAGQPRASARAEELEAEDAASKPAYREPWQEEVRVARFARRLLASARASGQAPKGPASSKPKRRLAWLVRDDGRAFRRPDGPPVSLERRGTLSRILRALAERHATSPGQALDVYELGEAGWPGQRIGTEAAANRVRVALTTLRKLGLRDLLVSRDDGYLLDPKARVAIVTDMNRPA